MFTGGSEEWEIEADEVVNKIEIGPKEKKLLS